MSKCDKQGHRYEKFDERSIFCERCGDQKFLTSAYQPSWTYYPPIYPYIHWYAPPYVVTSGTVTTSGFVKTTDWNGNQFTLTDGSVD